MCGPLLVQKLIFLPAQAFFLPYVLHSLPSPAIHESASDTVSTASPPVSEAASAAAAQGVSQSVACIAGQSPQTPRSSKLLVRSFRNIRKVQPAIRRMPRAPCVSPIAHWESAWSHSAHFSLTSHQLYHHPPPDHRRRTLQTGK